MTEPQSIGLIRTVAGLKQALGDGLAVSYTFFWHGEPRTDGQITVDCFSQWWPSPFEQFGITFATAEHYMMWRKALLFGDERSADQVLSTSDPSVAKRIGRQIDGFDEATWVDHRWRIVVSGTFAKFASHDELQRLMLSTAESVIVEASPYDRVWGIGMSFDATAATSPEKWSGLNLLGFALMEVRTVLRDAKRTMAAAMAEVPEEPDVHRQVARRMASEHNGHVFAHGWHIGWVWGADQKGSYVEVLSEHRMTDTLAARVYATGEREMIPTPMELMDLGPYTTAPNKGTPEYQRMKDDFLATNRERYDDLRHRGLLPPRGTNIGSQDINEVLRRGEGLMGT